MLQATIEDGALVAEKGKGGHLVTKNSYKNFQINAEFWADEEANSGIFIRCIDSTAIGARTCYEVNIFDKRPDPSHGTGLIVDFAEVNPMPKAAGKWKTSRSPLMGGISSWCSTDRKPSTSGTACSRGALHAAIRRGRYQIPQGCGQATLVEKPALDLSDIVRPPANGDYWSIVGGHWRHALRDSLGCAERQAPRGQAAAA